MLSSDQVLSRIRDNRSALKSLGIERIGLFGSYIRGEQKEGSDIDIIVSFKAGEEKYRNLFRVHELLCELFGTRIEIVTMGSLSPYIGPYILKEARFIETT
ncbi:MAG: nucleotidyltransferase family protein [Candidatus Thermoplasmatota archaeon]|nr:nucleotidyltransferase family protein [Candidatus Thermoplasmatota archaeon]